MSWNNINTAHSGRWSVAQRVFLVNKDLLWVDEIGLMIILLIVSMMVPQGLGVYFAILKCILDDFLVMM